jgi:hypothetical protein
MSQRGSQQEGESGGKTQCVLTKLRHAVYLPDIPEWKGEAASHSPTPMSKAIKNSEEFLIVHVIVEFWSRKCPAPESDGMEFPVVSKNGENARNGIVGCVRLDHNLTAGNPMMEYRSSRKIAFETVEGRLTSGCPIPLFASTSEAGEWNGNAGIAVNEVPIKVTKTEERLYILHFPRYGPICNSGNLVQRHAETVGRQNVAKVLASGDTELALGQLAE